MGFFIQPAFAQATVPQSIDEYDLNADDPPTILVLHSYYPTLEWSNMVTKGISDTFADSRYSDAEIYLEYMDAKRHPDAEYISSLEELYRHKYADLDEFDLIICSDNHAINFITSNAGKQIFPAVPVVFCGANSFYDPGWKENRPNLTGSVEVIEPAATLELMLDLHPDTKKILVVSDHNTLTSKLVTRDTREGFEAYNEQVQIDYLENMNATQMQQEVANLSEDSLVFLLVFNNDKDGEDFTFHESMKMVYTNSNVPVYSLWDFYLGQGIVGGKLVSGEEEGRTAAELAIRVLDGENISEIPVVIEPKSNYMFDWNQMERFSISAPDLPEGSMIINREPSFYERYQNQIYATIIPLFVLQSILVSTLYFNRRRLKDTEEFLRSSEEKYSTIVEKGNDGIIIVQDHVLKLVNSMFARTLGYRRDEIIGKPLADLISAENRDMVVARYEKGIKKDATVASKYEVDLLSKDGTKVPIELNTSIIEYENEPAVMAIIRNITERRKLDNMKDEFLSNVGHELKTPLISIIGYGELMVDGTLGPLNEQQKKAMDAVERNSRRLRRLIDSLLYLSIARAGKIKYSSGPLQMAEVIDGVISQMSSEAKKKGSVIQKDIPENLPPINGDEYHLKKVLVDIVDNSIKFTPSGGLITIKAKDEGEDLHIEVKDTGIGIPEDMIPEVFKLFYQIDGSTTRKYEGTGLGMYVCKQIIEGHNGRIWIESEEGSGTTVHLLLPK